MATPTAKNPNPTSRTPRLPEALTSPLLGTITVAQIREAVTELERRDADRGDAVPSSLSVVRGSLSELAGQIERYHRAVARNETDEGAA